MTRWPVAQRAWRDGRRGLAGWSVGVGLFTLLNVAAYPSMAGRDEFNELLDEYPDELLAMFMGGDTSLDLTSPVGYLNSQLFALMLPVLLAVLAIGFGSATVAGEEDRGLLSLVLAGPIRRTSLVRQKQAVLAARVITVVGANNLVAFGVGRAFELTVSAEGIAAVTVNQILLALVLGLGAMAVGCATGRRATAAGAAAGAAVATYLVGSLAPVVSWLAPLRWVSPFAYATGSNPLGRGFALDDVAVLAATAAVLSVVGAAVFERRDLQR